MSKSFFAFGLAIGLSACAAAATADDAETWAARIDERLSRRQESLGIMPAPTVDDARFLRRVTLDLIGRIPTVAETRDYLADESADKARRLVRRLIASPRYARHWSTVWRRAWIPQADTPQFAFLADETERWLADQLQCRTPHDAIVRRLFEVARIDDPTKASGLQTPRALLIAGESKPENLAANATRAFLGLNLDCAQCHDHPFARWTRDEFWQTAAFFTVPDERKDAATLEITIPETECVVAARYLDGRPWQPPAKLRPETGRVLLSRWITARDNPYFARHAVNTVWCQLFGVGLVEPFDDLARDDPQGDPEHLVVLAREAIAADLDLARLIEACVLTGAYRRDTSGLRPAADREVSPDDERFAFAQMPLRAMSGEQLFDSLRTAAGMSAVRDDLSRRETGVARREFAATFHIDRAESAARSVLQSLALMNGAETAAAVEAAAGPLVIAVAEGPFANSAERAETLFLAAFNRLPDAEERRIVGEYFDGAPAAERRRRTADVLWSLVNTAEFSTNH